MKTLKRIAIIAQELERIRALLEIVTEQSAPAAQPDRKPIPVSFVDEPTDEEAALLARPKWKRFLESFKGRKVS